MLLVTLPGSPSQLPEAIAGLHKVNLNRETTMAELVSLAAPLSSMVQAIVAGSKTPVELVEQAMSQWPGAKLYCYQGENRWASQPLSQNRVIGSRVEAADETGATTATEYRNRGVQTALNRLLNKCFLLHAWGEDQHFQEIRQLDMQFQDALEDEPEPELAGWAHRWESAKEQGRQACELAQQMLMIYRQAGEQAAVEFVDQAKVEQTADSILVHLRRVLGKQQEYMSKSRNKEKKGGSFKPSLHLPLNADGSHPWAVSGLKPDNHWKVLIDETGTEFSESVDDLRETDKSVGKLVALVMPATLSLPLQKQSHAVDHSDSDIEKLLKDLIEQPVGVLGFSSQDQVAGRFGWLQKVTQLAKWVLQLLPIEQDIPVQVDFRIEQKGTYNKKTSLNAVAELLFAELAQISPLRYRKLSLSMKFVRKEDEPYNGYVDSIANCWGSPSPMRRKILTNLNMFGHCLIRPSDDAVYERLLHSLDTKQALRPADWYLLMQEAGEYYEHSSSLLYDCMSQLGDRVRLDHRMWNLYVQEVQERLRIKDFQLEGLARAMDWLEQYQPEDASIPATLRMQQLSAALALQNHQGNCDLAGVSELLVLANRLTDEMAPQACEAVLRVMVAASNTFEFDTFDDFLNSWINRQIAVVGLANHAKLYSTQGQLLAFRGRPQEADTCFRHALEVFGRLSDTAQANREIRQTQTYQLFAWLSNASVSGDWFKERLIRFLQPLAGKSGKGVIERLARSGQVDRYAHQLTLRAMTESPALFAEERQQYLRQLHEWREGEDHPWPLISFYRAWMLLDKGDESVAGEYLNHALLLCEQSATPTLIWMGLVLQAVGAALDLVEVPAESERNRIREQLPMANHEALEKLCGSTEADRQPLLVLMAQCLPFNFH
tara:strand:+ start:19976 stop:22639 length:2664 start_codon:yes stop_codon:yes gene_type:complete